MLLRNLSNQMKNPRELSWYKCPRHHFIRARGTVRIGGSREIYCPKCSKIFLKRECEKPRREDTLKYGHKQTQQTRNKISKSLRKKAAARPRPENER